MVGSCSVPVDIRGWPEGWNRGVRRSGDVFWFWKVRGGAMADIDKWWSQ